MTKMIGSVLLFAACSGMGIWKSQQYQDRIRQMKILLQISEFLKGEITFARTTLPEALDRIGEKLEEPFSSFLHTLAIRMKKYSGEDFSHILQQTMDDTLQDVQMEKEDLDTFYQAACNLGYLDKEMQIHLLDRYMKEQEQKVEMLAQELPVKRKLFSSLGILGGAFFVILLL